jgi:phosphonate transport system substrate-binding protein
MKLLAAGILFLLLLAPHAWGETYTFGVLPHRNPVLTARYWNPILDYVGRKAGVTLELATRRDSQEYSAAEARGEFDFVYNNHIFAPSHAQARYRVIARPVGEPIRSQIVVADTSPIHSLAELQGQEVGFPNRNGFTGYAVPMVALYAAKVQVKPVFAGNQEGVMAQLKAGQIAAAAVNSRVMEEYAAREHFRYRVLWTSEPFLDLPVAVHPRVPAKVASAVQAALIGMTADAEGRRILEASAAVINQKPPYGFIAAQDAEYDNQRAVYRRLWQAEGRQ